MGYIIAFDPGETTGVCIFNEQGQIIAMDHLPLHGPQNIYDWIIAYSHPVDVVIYEKWVTFRQRAQQQTGSKQPAAEAIGAIKTFANAKKAKLVEQKPDIMPIASKWSGVKLPGTHSESHKFAAYLHGFYYLHQHGILKSKLEEEMGL